MANRLVYSLPQYGRARKILGVSPQPEGALLQAAWKPVVTAFVQRQDDKVLVVQRSAKVGTYQGQWGGVSGGVEGNEALSNRAYQEIEEEVGMPRHFLQLLRAGRPLPVQSGHHRFLVQPFLVRATSPDPQVQLNWENTDCRWVTARELAALPVVPQLPETLARLQLPPQLEEAVQQLLLDRSHGAAELAEWALERLASDEVVPAGEDSDCVEAQLELYRDFAFHLATARPSMAAVANAMATALLQMEEELMARAEPFPPPIGEVRAAMQSAASKVLQQLRDAQAALLLQGVELMRGHRCVLTLSYSSTVLDVLRRAQHSMAGSGGLSAIVCESRPLNEGVALAARLAEAGIHTTVITDAQAGLFVRQADCVLLGADAVLADAVVNKVGSHMLALAAHDASVPVYALATTSKLSPGPVTAAAPLPLYPEQPLETEEEKDASEVVSSWAPHDALPQLHVRNVYFERTPLRLLTGVVTEGGLLNAEELRSAVQSRLQDYRRAFYSH